LAALAPDVDRHLQDLANALARLRADGHDRREVEERDLVVDPLDVLVERPIRLVLDEIPLVDRDDEALALLDDIAGDVGVLRGQPLDRVDHEDGDVGPRDRLERSQRRIALRGRAGGDLAAASDARGIDEDHLATTPPERGVKDRKSTRLNSS